MKVFLSMSLFVYASWLAAIWPCWFRKCDGKVYQLQFLAFFGVMCTNIKFVWFGFAILSICVSVVCLAFYLSCVFFLFRRPIAARPRVCRASSISASGCLSVCWFIFLFIVLCDSLSFSLCVCTLFFSLFYFSFLNISIPALAWSSNPLFFFLQVIFVLNRWTFKAMIWFGILFRGIALV